MVICPLHDPIVEVVEILLSLERHLVIHIHKVKCESRLWAKHRCWIPTNAQELSIVFEEPIFGASAETEANSVMTRKVNDEHPVSFHRSGTALRGVSKVKNQAETLKRHTLEKAVHPDLKSMHLQGVLTIN